MRLMVLDISPTWTMYERTTMEFARLYYHWFFLIQPAPLPERLIGADPSFYLRLKLGGWGSAGLGIFDERALAEYERCFTPAAIHAPSRRSFSPPSLRDAPRAAQHRRGGSSRC